MPRGRKGEDAHCPVCSNWLRKDGKCSRCQITPYQWEKALGELKRARAVWVALLQKIPRDRQARKFLDEYMRLCREMRYAIGIVETCPTYEVERFASPFLMDLANLGQMRRFLVTDDGRPMSVDRLLQRYRSELNVDVQSLYNGSP